VVVLQGMDTSGKGGTIKHAIGAMNPQGVQVASFKKPTEDERRHHFLWRIRRRVPGPGIVGVFDRSHYEDVLVARVHRLAPAEEIERRYSRRGAARAPAGRGGVACGDALSGTGRRRLGRHSAGGPALRRPRATRLLAPSAPADDRRGGDRHRHRAGNRHRPAGLIR
jgi:hypothetical protein